MSLRTAIVSRVTERLFSAATERRRRAAAERARRAADAPHVVEYFHQTDDPYSHIAAQVLAPLIQRYDIALKPWLCSPPSEAAAPDRPRLVRYARTDAARLAQRAGLAFVDPGDQPDPAQIAEAEARLAAHLDDDGFAAAAPAIGAALWDGRAFDDGRRVDPAGRRCEGDARRTALGHYLSATFYYGGEWYWGLDRLHFLEARLAELGARRRDAPAAPIFAPPRSPTAAAPAGSSGGALDFFLSFRSPYTYIAAQRAKALADAYGAHLNLKFVLPMVMRGMPVPGAKRRYIANDTAREARRFGVPFGRIADPVGRPVERGYALLPWAIAEGRGHAYCVSFMQAVWAEGVDAGSQAGLRRIVERAGLDWAAARSRADNEDWRGQAERHRQEMFDLGLWGVPSFRFGTIATWGQDRLWVIEDAMRAEAENPR